MGRSDDVVEEKYWTRLWIIQEIALAKQLSVQCAPYNVPWSNFRAVCSQLEHFSGGEHTHYQQALQEIPKSIPFRLDGIRNEHYSTAGAPTTTLVDVFLRFRDAECEDIRDKVFGILSLCKSCCYIANSADYRMTPTSVASRMLEHHFSIHTRAKKGDQVIHLCSKVLHILNPLSRQIHSRRDIDHALDDFINTGPRIPVQTLFAGKIILLCSALEVDSKEAFKRMTDVIRDIGRRPKQPNLPLVASRMEEHYITPSERSTYNLLPIQCDLGLSGITHYHRIALERSHSLKYMLSRLRKSQSQYQDLSLDCWKDFLKEHANRISRQHRPAMAKSQSFFLSSTGMVGYVTQEVKINDTLCRLIDPAEAADSMAVVRVKDKGGSTIIGKALWLVPEKLYPAGIFEGQPNYPSISKDENDHPIILYFNVSTFVYLVDGIENDEYLQIKARAGAMLELPLIRTENNGLEETTTEVQLEAHVPHL